MSPACSCAHRKQSGKFDESEANITLEGHSQEVFQAMPGQLPSPTKVQAAAESTVNMANTAAEDECLAAATACCSSKSPQRCGIMVCALLTIR